MPTSGRIGSISLGVLAAILISAAAPAWAGPYSSPTSNNVAGAPDPGIQGFTSPGVVNPIFKGWASTVVEYTPAPGLNSSWLDSSKVLGPVTNDNMDIASLGDLLSVSNPPAIGETPGGVFSDFGGPYAGDVNDPNDGFAFIGIDDPGSITVGFEAAITNGTGADFAVFENGFNTSTSVFAELAYVEVSTNGTDFARFPSISTNTNSGAFTFFDSSNIYNLAGKHALGWGTPFDLDDLANHALVLSGDVDLSQINYVRLIDIPGDGSFLDSQANPIRDNWLTVGSGGFDFEALGVINQVPEPGSAVLLGLGSLMLIRRRH